MAMERNGTEWNGLCLSTFNGNGKGYEDAGRRSRCGVKRKDTAYYRLLPPNEKPPNTITYYYHPILPKYRTYVPTRLGTPRWTRWIYSMCWMCWMYSTRPMYSIYARRVAGSESQSRVHALDVLDVLDARVASRSTAESQKRRESRRLHATCYMLHAPGDFRSPSV